MYGSSPFLGDEVMTKTEELLKLADAAHCDDGSDWYDTEGLIGCLISYGARQHVYGAGLR